MNICRMWINQPSTSQPLHHLHGIKVLATPESNDFGVRVYFLDGDTVSMNVSANVLSDGWNGVDAKKQLNNA